MCVYGVSVCRSYYPICHPLAPIVVVFRLSFLFPPFHRVKYSVRDHSNMENYRQSLQTQQNY